MKRRQFLKVAGQSGLVLGLSPWSWSDMIERHEAIRLTILHTNDVHSRLDPFPDDGSRYANKGGVARRMKMIKQIRRQEPHVLLLDCGDILQGTPYFNMFDGEPEFKAMDAMGYDAATLGNHDFDGGIDLLGKLVSSSKFEMINCNYDLSDTVLAPLVRGHKIFERGGIRIGVTGVGIELDGLVPQSLYKGTRYLDPIRALNSKALELKEEHQCDLVIVLSHLGFQYRNEKISDVRLAASSRHVDMILGGHTHTFLRDPDIIMNLDDEPVVINQVGWAGVLLGRIDVSLQKGKKNRKIESYNTWVEQWR